MSHRQEQGLLDCLLLRYLSLQAPTQLLLPGGRSIGKLGMQEVKVQHLCVCVCVCVCVGGCVCVCVGVCGCVGGCARVWGAGGGGCGCVIRGWGCH